MVGRPAEMTVGRSAGEPFRRIVAHLALVSRPFVARLSHWFFPTPIVDPADDTSKTGR
jgi:hypothetical protein